MSAAYSPIQIACFVSQDLLPATPPSQLPNGLPKQPTRVVGTGSGYGPPLPQGGSPLMKVVSSVLYEPEPTPSEAYNQQKGSGKTPFDLVCIPITNYKWRERWERMCTVTTDNSQPNTQTSVSGLVNSASRRDFVSGAPEALELDEAVREEAEAWRNMGGFQREEVNITRSEEAGSLMGLASQWLELDSPVEGIRFDSEIGLRNEVLYAAALSVHTMIVPGPRLDNTVYLGDYARAISGILAASWHMNISILMPVVSPQHGMNPTPAWEAWNIIRTICEYNPRLSVSLHITGPVPPAQLLTNWNSEPIKSIFIPATVFIKNSGGYPVLSRNTQLFVKALFRYNPTVILSQTHKGNHPTGGKTAYPLYIRHLLRQSSNLTPVEKYAQGYMDHLQSPLQPLFDNLEGETYEGFEKDPVKYERYEEAVYQALMDRDEKSRSVIFVVGAGRGPLVAGCLRASERSKRLISLTAVEKNPSAMIILQERKAQEWGNAVRLEFCDMRDFRPKEKADIIVSELLGSFGDNELSPECLDGVIRCLKVDGISIPSSYTAFITPISTPKLHSDIATSTKPMTSQPDGNPSEQPYVVMFSSVTHLAAEIPHTRPKIQECWTFEHPRSEILMNENGIPLSNSHNTRSCHLVFTIPQAGLCHGFAGYFEAVLYGNVRISTNPDHGMGDMLSWFPIYFPLETPIYLPGGSELEIKMWRLVEGKRKVWFEWSAAAYLPVTGAAAVPQTVPALGSLGLNISTSSLAPYGSTSSPDVSMDTMSHGQSRILINHSKLHNPNGRSSACLM